MIVIHREEISGLQVDDMEGPRSWELIVLQSGKLLMY